MFGYRNTLETVPIQIKLYTTRLRKTILLSLRFKEFLPKPTERAGIFIKKKRTAQTANTACRFFFRSRLVQFRHNLLDGLQRVVGQLVIAFLGHGKILDLIDTVGHTGL